MTWLFIGELWPTCSLTLQDPSFIILPLRDGLPTSPLPASGVGQPHTVSQGHILIQKPVPVGFLFNSDFGHWPFPSFAKTSAQLCYMLWQWLSHSSPGPHTVRFTFSSGTLAYFTPGQLNPDVSSGSLKNHFSNSLTLSVRIAWGSAQYNPHTIPGWVLSQYRHWWSIFVLFVTILPHRHDDKFTFYLACWAWHLAV